MMERKELDRKLARIDEDCDKLAIAHLNAISSRHGSVAVARAILAATPSMLLWWCRRLQRADE